VKYNSNVVVLVKIESNNRCFIYFYLVFVGNIKFYLNLYDA